ncbi:MAG: hypothetical protein M3Z23_06930 [Acidobacteriota bacterium]|nr:hypothetical protein [Acidobacteriota bacterium]
MLGAFAPFGDERRPLIVLEDAHTPEAAALVCAGRSSTLLTDAPVREYEPAGPEGIQRAFAVALEAFEMEALYPAARGRGDYRIVEEAAREQIWILEQWDRLEDADNLRGHAGARHARQLAFEFR